MLKIGNFRSWKVPENGVKLFVQSLTSSNRDIAHDESEGPVNKLFTQQSPSSTGTLSNGNPILIGWELVPVFRQ